MLTSRALPWIFLVPTLVPAGLWAQEASAGFDLRATMSGMAVGSGEFTEAPRSGSLVDGGFRGVVYPTWKFGEHWVVSAAYQVVSRPWFFESFSTQGHGVTGSLLQGTIGYARTGSKGSILFRAGQMSSAFGAFLLHYDDADNALIGTPLTYGYYYQPVSPCSLAAAQVDATRGKWDGRVQFANSSPANPRSIFARDQYANWAGGAGYTVVQGIRLGFSTYRGPYLDRRSPFYFPGEANPNALSAQAWGVDAEVARGHWNIEGEWQKFRMPYRAIPVFRQQGGYVEVKRVLHPRWYIAARAGYLNTTYGGSQSIEAVVGFRPDRVQLIKIGYAFGRSGDVTDGTLAVQLVTTLHPLSLAWK